MASCPGTVCGGAACTCGCCEPAGPATPLVLWNRPGLARIDYRVGTYGSFRRAMLLAVSRHSDLRRWTARDDDDYGIALLSMWAYVADVLTFYGERVAHEAFLATAVQPRSLRRLAGLLDYLPSPGASATAHLAYVAEAGKPFQVRPRMRVQSVPGQDERPQKFEPGETVAVEPALNAVPVLPAPVGGGVLAVGTSAVTLHPAQAAQGPALAVGDKLLAVAGGGVEEKTVTAVEHPDWRTVVRFAPALQAAGATLYKLRRKIRLFGYHAPDPWLKPILSGTVVTGFEQLSPNDSGYEVEVASTDAELHLEGSFDLGAGTTVLVAGVDEATSAPFTRERTVTASATAAKTVGPLSGAVTRLTLGSSLGVATDLRTVTVHELAEVVPGEAELLPWSPTYPPSLSVDDTEVYVRAEAENLPTVLPGVEDGRRLVLADATGAAQVVTASGPPTAVPFAGVAHLRVGFDPPLAVPLETATAVLLGNVAEATHGESVVGEVLGSGDASRAFPVFPVAKPRVSHVPDPTAEHGARSTLEVRVDGVLWHPVRSFYGSGPEDRVYVARVDEEGRTRVRFGDGRTGARVTSGKNNVTATYRHGLGLAGRVAAGSLRVALDRPPGLKSVGNPLPASGGSDPEDPTEVRRNAPNGVRTFGRIVSLADFEDAAREYAGVAKAKAVERWVGEERELLLFVAGDGGAVLGGPDLADLRAFLDLRRDPHRRLTVADHRPVAVVLELSIETDPDHEPETVGEAVEAALRDHFDFAARDLGQAVHLSDLFRAAQEVTGVLGVDFDRCTFRDPTLLPHLDRRSLRFEGTALADLQPRLLLFADELAVLEPAASDVVVHLGIPGAGSSG